MKFIKTSEPFIRKEQQRISLSLKPVFDKIGEDAKSSVLNNFEMIFNIPQQRRNNSINHDEEEIKKEEAELADVKHYSINEST
jgi:hypothetical protein